MSIGLILDCTCTLVVKMMDNMMDKRSFVPCFSIKQGWDTSGTEVQCLFGRCIQHRYCTSSSHLFPFSVLGPCFPPSLARHSAGIVAAPRPLIRPNSTQFVPPATQPPGSSLRSSAFRGQANFRQDFQTSLLQHPISLASSVSAPEKDTASLAILLEELLSFATISSRAAIRHR